jgi:glutathione S-transferase
MKLYEWNWTPSSRRLRIFLLEKGIEIPTEEVSTPDLRLEPWFRAIYPHAMAPMLELEDGTQIGEVFSIWLYLEALHPDPPLLGTTAVEKATVAAWERRAYDEGMIGYAEISRNSHPQFVNRGLPGYPEPVPQIPALIERGKLRVDFFHKKFDRQLAWNRFVAGERFSVADITTVSAIDYGRWLDLAIPGHFRNLKRWYAELQQIESVRKSLPYFSPNGTPIIRSQALLSEQERLRR